MNEDYLKKLGDDIALAHWAQPDEKTYEDICDRVVNYICDDTSDEGRHYNSRMKDLLKQKKFLPNSPCWINAGTDMKNLFACYVVDLQDNMSSIMDTAKRMAMIMKEGGGVGVSLTPIRAEGSRVGPENGSRTASGPISFLKVFDAVVGAVKSAGVRRGAALANLKTGHPDLIKFIKCKEDQNQINNFNLSVAITDEFMNDVMTSSDKIWAKDEEGIGYTASAIYDLIVEHMWRNGEPGVQFIDTVNNVDGKYTGRPEFKQYNTGIEVSNPCILGTTLVLTKELGAQYISSLVGKEVSVWNGKKWSKVTPYSTGNNKILRVWIRNNTELGPITGCFAEGKREHDDLYIYCTPYHKFILADGTRKEASELKPGDKLYNLDNDSLDSNTNVALTRVNNNTVLGIEDNVFDSDQETFCLTEPEEHAFTIIAGSFYSPLLIGNCGESFLKPNEACNLGSINLYHFVNPFWKGHDDKKDMALKQELKQTVEDAVEFLNKMLDKSVTPFDDINATVKASRKVGLGVMGVADYLSAKGIVYGSSEAIHETEDLFNFITTTAEDFSLKKGYRNSCLTIQAPTGTTGLVGEASTGIEPHFLRCWTRHSLKMGDLLMYPKSLRDYIENLSSEIDDSPRISYEIAVAKDLKRAMDESNFKEFSELLADDNNVTNEIGKFWPTAHEIKPGEHLLMLAAVQRNVHNSVSKTINLPHEATVEDVKELITMAWESGCKGFTCYRDGSRDSQPLKAVDRKDSDKKYEEIKKSIENGETAFIPRSEYDELLRRAKILEELNDSVDTANEEEIYESDKEILKKVHSNEWMVIKHERFEKLVEKAKTVDKMEKLISRLPASYLPTNAFVKDFAKDSAKDNNVLSKNIPCKRPRPNTTYGETIKTKIGCGAMYITVNSDEHGICEVFTSLGRNGGCPSQSEATSRLISLALRSGVSVEDVIDQLKGIRCMNTMRQGGIKQADGSVVLSCPDAIGKTMERVYNDKNSSVISDFASKIHDPSPEDSKVFSMLLEDEMIDDGNSFMATISKPGMVDIKKMRDCTKEENDSIDKYIESISIPTGVNIFDVFKCPECGKELTREGGCIICRHCGYSKCG